MTGISTERESVKDIKEAREHAIRRIQEADSFIILADTGDAVNVIRQAPRLMLGSSRLDSIITILTVIDMLDDADIKLFDDAVRKIASKMLNRHLLAFDLENILLS